MKYRHIVPAEFIDRPNRFVAYVKIGGKTEKVHVKNTGRCRELLQKGATVYLEKSDNPNRSTAYDLVAVEKGERLINMDSQAPNRVVEEWLYKKELFPHLLLVRPETKYGNSRFDFYVETKEEKIFIEVKGVTLEKDGVVSFPDAPSQRAVKHMEELVRAKRSGYRVFVIFVIQMEDVAYFMPNSATHEEFAKALEEAAKEGVEILAYDCFVTADSMQIGKSVPVFLNAYRKNLPDVKIKLSLGELSAIPKPLLKWYDSNRRILPWREEPTPYRVWVSEIMLQQTRVEAVKPYFRRFMDALPDVRALAYADEEKLLKLWEGLGYYNRVRNLQKAALQIMEEYDGQIPEDYRELCKLKGIGSYTAGAISSIAFGQAKPAVDGNVLRVLSRIREDDRPVSDSRVKTAVERELEQIIPKDRPGDFNQAMMELGACVCVPGGASHCGECPLMRLCRACENGSQRNFPHKDKGRARSVEEKTVLVIRDEGRVAVRKRAGKGLLEGMYEFPCLQGYCTAEQVAGYLAGNGMKLLRIMPLEEAKHIFTHKEWHMKGYMVRVDELEPKEYGGEDWIYINPDEIREKFPMPSAFEAYTKYLNIKLGNKRFREEQ